ncbi:MAG: hypothetical protein ACOYOV_11375 [Bacteroidales bacterium]
MAKTNKATWQDKYEIQGILPGIIVTQKGEIDLSNEDIPLETFEQLEADGCPFIKKKMAEKPV